jgi:hypothetical protein
VGVDPKRSEPALERRVGWQPSRFLTDRAEAERAYALADTNRSVPMACGPNVDQATVSPLLR